MARSPNSNSLCKASKLQSISNLYNPHSGLKHDLKSVMWIRIDRMRIRIQDNKFTKLISNHLLNVKKKKKSVP